MPPDVLEEAKQKRKALLGIFDALPPVTISGVVGANGPGASRLQEETWSLHLEMVAWRTNETPVRKEPLIVSKQVSDDELHKIQASIARESIITFQGKLCEESPFGNAQAQLLRLLPPAPDSELDSVLADYRQPVEMTDRVLGRLVLNKAVDWFEGELDWLGDRVRLAIALDEDRTLTDSLLTARTLVSQMEGWTKQVSKYAVAELLQVKNDSWLSEGERPISGPEFLRCMHLTSITAYANGEFEFWHDDCDLFWGHAIVVRGSLSDGIAGTDIAG